MIFLYPTPEPAHADASTQTRPTRPPPPLRLPRHLQQALSKPLATADDVDELMQVIRAADARGLL
ncbi:MAG: hypothetical protein AB7I35_03035 [Ramlibacter sp.]|nr:hypothetical protein [Ramlibacter sp.]